MRTRNPVPIILSKEADISRYQLLCANCNWIKKSENEEVVGRRTYKRKSPTARNLETPEAKVIRLAKKSAEMRKAWEKVSPEERSERIKRTWDKRRAAKTAA